MTENTTIAVDLARSVYEIAVSHEPCRVGERHRLTHGRLAAFFATRPAATLVMECCGTAHHWARLFERLAALGSHPGPEPTIRYTQRPEI